jgi:hypothetical protein
VHRLDVLREAPLPLLHEALILDNVVEPPLQSLVVAPILGGDEAWRLR